jgi:hypothetical protein
LSSARASKRGWVTPPIARPIANIGPPSNASRPILVTGEHTTLANRGQSLSLAHSGQPRDLARGA